MTDISEVDDIIFKQLGIHDLAQCARVSKRWHTIATPFLWKDISCLDHSSISQRQAFARLVLVNYLERQEEESDAEQCLQARSPHPFSTLAKYRHWIRVLPGINGLQLLVDSIHPPQATDQDEGPTKDDLYLHLVKSCRSAEVSVFYLNDDEYESHGLKKIILESILSRVRHLSVQASYHRGHPGFLRLKTLLGQCSTALEKLTLDVKFEYGDDWGWSIDGATSAEEEHVDVVDNEWTCLKELVLCPAGCIGGLEPRTFWSWLFKRCGHVEKLDVSAFRRGTHEDILEAMVSHMPILTELILGTDSARGSTIKDYRTADILSGSRKGWKSITLKYPVWFQDASLEALTEHLSTLEELYVDLSAIDFTSTAVVRVLSRCPKLHTLVDTDIRPYCSRGEIYLEAKEFIDKDPDTGLLKTWECEDSLRVLKIKITGIPRPDIDGNDGITDVQPPSQGQETQMLIYERLSRLTNLETLWLGDGYHGIIDDHNEEFMEHVDGLAMSLESGLGRLSTLELLKELSVTGMTVKIGVKEVQWMTEHWPNLRLIYGLDRDDAHKEAVEWLERHHRDIEIAVLNA
ncbi:hypothetical protein B0O80DRAFT_499566 [Mortierella sp. GBAus27b]|nr:hypothetical protein BGX31_001761 [Mortierella sp. GBA43]KAI8352263.1 hypothetical protein B0O80DRAFT_499566 [Mortierella sp. GBAus27b]